MGATTFSGSFVKAVKSQFNINDTAYILTGSDDPTSVAKDAPAGSIYIKSDNKVFKKLDAGSSTNWDEFATLAATQTLTNKTIDASSNTISNLLHGTQVDEPSSGTHGVTGTIVGTSDTQTLTNKTFDDATTNQHIATPSNPSAGYNKLYFKTDNKLYILDSAGNESALDSVLANDLYSKKTAAYTITDVDRLAYIETSGSTITLPDPANNANRVIKIKKIPASAGTDAWSTLEIIRNNSSDTIDGIAASLFLSDFYTEIGILCVGTNEYVTIM